MHEENFNESAGVFPLTKTRMAELQRDIQAPLKLIAGMLPAEDCIVSGCEEAGAAGYAVVGLTDEGGETRYEVMEVRSGVAGSYLNLVETPVTVTDDEGEAVLVRTERYLDWSYNASNSAPSWEYAGMKRLWAKRGAQDDAGWTACANGTSWNPGTDGSLLQVNMSGGRVHLTGRLTYQPFVIVTQELINLGYFANGTMLGSLQRTKAQKSVYQTAGVLSEVQQHLEVSFQSNSMTLPVRYRPTGDVLVAVRYNGAAAYGIVGSNGVLTLDRTPEIGDTIVIDTYIEL